MTMIIHKWKVELKKKRNGDMGRVSTCQKNCNTIDLRGAQVNHRIDSLVAKLENSAMVATHWFDINGMESNQSKFQAMILNKHPDQNNISLNVNGTNVPLKSCVKLLGVFIDYELTLSEHVNYTCKRTSRQLNAIRRITKYLKRDCLMKLFHAFISSNFTNGILPLNRVLWK